MAHLVSAPQPSRWLSPRPPRTAAPIKTNSALQSTRSFYSGCCRRRVRCGHVAAAARNIIAQANPRKPIQKIPGALL